MIAGKRIILGITGGIAAYKGAALCSKLVQAGASVHVIMTKSAAEFVTPLTLQTLSRNPVHIDTFDERNPEVVTHIHLADHADLIVIAPATANFMAKLANGHADDMLGTTLLAATCPILVAPAMNVHMYEHPAVVDNMERLAARGVMFVEPGTGQLACGYVAKGRLAEPEDIVTAVGAWFSQNQKLKGKKVVVTAGGTMERLDPVRYLTNDSSGKMGFAIAEAARLMGADVTLIAGRTTEQPPQGVKVVRTQSAAQMLEAVTAQFQEADIVVKAAAVADYRPVLVHEQKLKKTGERLVLELERTTDILATIGEQKTHQFLVGFAAETENLEQYAMDKLRRKHCDLIIANDVSREGVGFNGDTNAVEVYGPEGLVESLPLMSKRATAVRLLELISERIVAGGGSRL
ncbi:bifunctional phosphopantothenoylcysteine decarboxylase/phosphopantothenate--cysteine ligase CoaBC [Paenibacillus sp. 1011MAR3C5]|uniref:bifunctional phosphopantothenoylcysteine decarboxylase/phosphopantothenate--cysteine ligase CoaBC n=1 Tax=Paenibacillus sp. 1011MAR3C5 TaxID=1675787 RepID=UPI000E6CDE1D|nr:bifunctional phosphopantothenoylcysteine decarboxylase/phosphopantothenate--cysteine ligase CoaBC [Paenibacillus sp. 1011MAR3C5]RJE90559.1 bifunctional phosphopantothenoylcysteine decarboxylase/phosphopantothenate--cysteine ligase CoaBC [Paenibacillus sp. 1011MAR3C5]